MGWLDRFLGKAQLKQALREAQALQKELIGRFTLLSQSNALLMQEESRLAKELAKLKETNTNLFNANNAKQAQIEMLNKRLHDLEGQWQESKEAK